MKYIINTILQILLIISCGYIYGQQPQISTSLPSVIPPSPDAAALGKYGQYPVSLNNGLVDISIPIYTIKLPKLEVPVSLSYHASGIKVDEVASCVGLGWVLNAGGVITRSVKSLPDNNFPASGNLHDKNFVNNTLTSGELILEYLQIQSTQEERGVCDNESDVYYYNVNGMSGSFRYDLNGNIVQIPLTNNKIEYDQGTNKFTITSSDGTRYVFGEVEKSRLGGKNGSNAPWPIFDSSWYLSYIITTDNNAVDFSYLTDNTSYEEDYENFQVKECNNSFCSVEYCGTELPEGNRTISVVVVEQTKVLQRIDFPGGSLRFTLADDRADRRKYRVSKISVHNEIPITSLIKDVVLNHSYFTTTGTTNDPVRDNSYSSHVNYRLKLDDITINQTEKYSFGYNTTVLLPQYYSTSLVPNVSNYYGQDHWGYYNGVSTNSNLLTCYPFEYNADPIANRNVDAFSAQACILKKITYPTGGYTEFNYEGNIGKNDEKSGGLRIKSISSYNLLDPTPVIKTYEYGLAENSFWSVTDISGKKFTRGTNFLDSHGIIVQLGYNYYVSSPSLPLSFNSGAPVLYGKVTEYEGDASTNNGKTDYYFEYAVKDVDWYVPEGINYPSYFITKFDSYNVDRGWKRGSPTVTEYFVNKGGAYTRIKRIENDYTVYNFQKVNVGFFAFSNCYPLLVRWDANLGLRKDEAKSYFQYNDIPVETGLKKLTKTTEYNYTDAGTIATETNYAYDHLDNQYQVSSVTKILSNGSILKSEYTYPKDVSASSSIYQEMVNRNMLSNIVNIENYLDGQFTDGVYTTYYAWPNNIIAPSAVETKTGSADPALRLRFFGYNSRGNVLGVSKGFDVKYSYIWGHNQTLPIVMGENIDNATLEIKVALAMTIAGITKLEDITDPGNAAAQKTKWKNFNISLKNSLPANARVTTYTYKPLVGITSQTDFNGVTTYYLYDYANRLYSVLDNSGNILKTYKYHYKE